MAGYCNAGNKARNSFCSPFALSSGDSLMQDKFGNDLVESLPDTTIKQSFLPYTL